MEFALAVFLEPVAPKQVHLKVERAQRAASKQRSFGERGGPPACSAVLYHSGTG
jgi:hypothetical protein